MPDTKGNVSSCARMKHGKKDRRTRMIPRIFSPCKVSVRILPRAAIFFMRILALFAGQCRVFDTKNIWGRGDIE